MPKKNMAQVITFNARTLWAKCIIPVSFVAGSRPVALSLQGAALEIGVKFHLEEKDGSGGLKDPAKARGVSWLAMK